MNAIHLNERLVCEECEGEIDVPDEFGEASCCTACGVAYFFQAAEQRPSTARTASA